MLPPVRVAGPRYDRLQGVAPVAPRRASVVAVHRIMGVVNVTPDSFSDGGEFLDAEVAIRHAVELAEEGADILDVGGESTRPGSVGVDAEAELRRVLPVIDGIRAAGLDTRISVDTSKAAVAAAALDAGADYVNDVTALRGDPELAGLVADRGADVCLMHMLGSPRTMQDARATATSSTRSRPSSRSASRQPSGRGSPSSGSSWTRASASARRSRTTSS